MAQGSGPTEEISALSAIDNYTEYKRIVGSDDGGIPFKPKKYEEYIRRIKPIRLNNRIYVSWSNSEGMDCKLVGPETDCFCKHKYKEHKTDFEVIPDERPIQQPCNIKGCTCSCYHYIPSHGKQDVKCSCKHYVYDHEAAQPYLCSYDTCSCKGFTTSHTCACGQSAKQHRTITETKQERQKRGHPVGKDTLYQAMGGLTGFSSVLEGYVRLDDSGAGAPDESVLNEPITSTDHPYLRANVHTINAHKKAVGAPEAEQNADLTERMSQLRRPGENELAFYERRYKERQHTGSKGTSKPLKGIASKSNVGKSPYEDNLAIGIASGSKPNLNNNSRSKKSSPHKGTTSSNKGSKPSSAPKKDGTTNAGLSVAGVSAPKTDKNQTRDDLNDKHFNEVFGDDVGSGLSDSDDGGDDDVDCKDKNNRKKRRKPMERMLSGTIFRF